MNYQHYRKNPVLAFPERTWPNKEIEKAPIWCSVDLRDGNQALVDPMGVDEKMEFFEMILKLGIKEIEIGFPAASQIEYDFLRKLVAENKIPSDVKVQILSQCRKELIDKSFEAIQGIDNVIFHIYKDTIYLMLPCDRKAWIRYWYRLNLYVVCTVNVQNPQVSKPYGLRML